ncbi:MAG: translocation/assembly module TamB domain-containing protein [Acidobacteriota bacterium]
MKVKDTARRVLRHARRGGTIVLVVLVASIVTTFTVDVGPWLRSQAELAGSRQIDRPLRIGGLSVRLFDGRFVVRDLVIDGLTPQDEPFLQASEIVVSVAMAGLLRQEIRIDTVEMRDWRMTVETFPGGKHNFPRFTSRRPSVEPSRITTTVSYVHAQRGQFTYRDHGTPWSAVIRNLDVTVLKLVGYRGHSTSSGGTVAIQRFEPMAAELRTWFRIADGRILLDRIELDTDGAVTVCTGEVDTRRWPEQRYDFVSRVQLPRMREIFWARESFSLAGEAAFDGTFHLFKGGRELTGEFKSDEAGLNRFRFPQLEGSIVWTPDRFEVTSARSRFYGGTSRFTYLMAPLGRSVPATYRFDASYEDVDLAAFSAALEFDGLRLAGRASGHNLLEWPSGRFKDRQGFGHIEAVPPPGVTLQGRQLPETIPPPRVPRAYGDPFPVMADVEVGGSVNYQFGPEWVDIAPSRAATPTTFVEFQGRTSWGERTVMPFHVTSTDWQESDRLLAGIMTAFGAPTRPVEMGGAGTFDGVMLNAFRRPRIEGLFAGREMRAWDVVWGDGRSQITVENSYLDVKDAMVHRENATLYADGRFSLGYPRQDGGEELNARIRTEGWPLADLRHAFDFDDYPLDGPMNGEFHLYGPYTGPFGFGRLTIAPGAAYGEAIASASASLRFEGTGVWFDGLDVRKGATGVMRGAAHVEWEGSYSFNVDARRVPFESIDMLTFPKAPLTGLAEFTASGSGRFEFPTYEVRGRMLDLFVADEGVGQVTGRIDVRGDDLLFEFAAGSARLEVSGTGRVTTAGDYPGDVSLRFSETSLDPYARVFFPGLSPFATAVASGTLRASGSFSRIEDIVASTHVDRLSVSLFDYPLRNSAPIEMSLRQGVIRIEDRCLSDPAESCGLRLAGDGTGLAVSGTIDALAERFGMHAEGEANLGVLQAFFRDIRSAGQADVIADVGGSFDRPLIGGRATISRGRLRHMWLPHAIESLNGDLVFAGSSIRLDGVTAQVGRGGVAFGGRLGLTGFWPSDLDLTASGEAMELRYPVGFRSLVDAELALRGPIDGAILSGTVNVRRSSLTRRFDLGTGLIELAGASQLAAPSPGPAADALPLRFDLRILAPSTLEIDNNVARITSSADLTLRGTYDRPLLFGRAEVERGEVLFEGRRYVVTRGNIEFSNPSRIEPVFDVEAETRVRVPGQTYQVTLRAMGTLERLNPELSSDPPLPEVDIVALLLGDVRSTQDPELRALQSPDQAERTLLQARAARLLTSPIASNVERVVEQTFGVDTFQIAPMLTDPSDQTLRFSPGARLTIGKRISDRVYLTYSRSLSSSTRDQVILLEYDQSDRLSWILTQNEDRTYALDVRVRRVFR